MRFIVIWEVKIKLVEISGEELLLLLIAPLSFKHCPPISATP